MIIVIPSGIQLFAWITTILTGTPRFRTPLLWIIGFIVVFIMGGLTGVMFAAIPFDQQTHDTYFVVAHFHYVIFGGAVFGLFGGMYYWWPKVFGRLLSEPLGKLHFLVMLVGFNLTFGPMHVLGLQGMIRRTYTYPESLGLTFWNQAATIGSYLIALSILIFLANVVITHAKAKPADVADPWDARTLEWMTPSPPPIHNFDEIPSVHALDEYWHRKYVEDERTGRLVPAQAGAADGVVQVAQQGAGRRAGSRSHQNTPSIRSNTPSTASSTGNSARTASSSPVFPLLRQRARCCALGRSAVATT
jgi:cytochrome c oxidase subunit I